MTASAKLSGRLLVAPKAMLLDFGGVIVETAKIAGWRGRLASHVADVLRKAGAAATLTLSRIEADI